MFSNKGELVTRAGIPVPVTVDMVSLDGPGRTGHLRCDTSRLETIDFLYPIRVTCEDGTLLDIAVTSYSDRHMSFIGRVSLEVSLV